VTNNSTLGLINLTLMNGRFAGAQGQTNSGDPGMGGSIFISGGAVDLATCRFINNQAIGGDGGSFQFFGGVYGLGGGPGLGGAVYAADGQVRASGCVFAGNSSTGGAGGPGDAGGGSGNGGNALGGAIYTSNSALSLTGSTFTNNLGQAGAMGPGRPASGGGAVAVQGNTTEIMGCIFQGNRVLAGTKVRNGSDAAGGAVLHDGGSMAIDGSLFNGNTAQGGDGADLGSGYKPIFGDAKGGAVFNYSGSLELRNSALVNNQATGGTVPEACGLCYFGAAAGQGLGGALYNEGQLSVINCTAVGNAANGGQGMWLGQGASAAGGSAYGGAIYSATNSVSLLNVTIAANSVQGGTNAWGGNAPASGACIAIAGGTAALTNSIVSCLPGQTNVFGAVIDGGHNISSDASASFTASSSRNNLDPLLGPLADNGGSTPTMTLLPGSPALDAGDDSACPPTDQRGVGRPCGPHSDIGAFEQIVSEPLKFTFTPQGLTLLVGQTASFYAAVNNLVSYQWQFQGTNLAGATNSLLVLHDLQLSQAGDYSVVASSSSGSITSAPAKLSVLPPVPPVIVSQPQDQFVPEGQPASFSVMATNLLPLTYQWQHNGTNLPGATESGLSFTSTRLEDAGTYTAVVSTKYLSITSSPALLTVASALYPSILTQPADATVTEAGTATISVVARGGAPLSYLWRFEGVDLPGTTGPTLTLTNVSVTQAGTYNVTVSNAVGQVSSQPAVLSVKSSVLDPGFVPATTTASPVAVQKDGKVIVAPPWGKGLVRLNGDGSLDKSFVWPFPYVRIEGNSLQTPLVALRPDGKIVAVVASDSVAMVLVNPDGSVDPSFDAGPAISFQTSYLGLEPDGKVVVNSSRQPPVLVRINQDGTRDGSFSSPDLGQDILENLLVQPDGKLVLSLYDPNQGRVFLARLDAQGARERGFNLALGYGDDAEVLAMPEDGKLIIGGSIFSINDAPVTNLVRLNIDDSIDPTFHAALPISSIDPALPPSPMEAAAVTLDEFGMIYVGGSPGRGRDRSRRPPQTRT
jgi:uncharacterized delta-60 repeat protein